MDNLQDSGYFDDLKYEIALKINKILYRLEHDEVYISKIENRMYKAAYGKPISLIDYVVNYWFYKRSFVPSKENGYMYKGRIW